MFLSIVYLLSGLFMFDELRRVAPCPKTTSFSLTVFIDGFFAIICITILIICAIVYWKFHTNHVDAFQMKSEHRACLIFVGIAFFIFILLVCSNQPTRTASIPITFACNVVFLTGTVWPYFLSLKELAVENKTLGLLEELKRVLLNENARGEFFRYLQLEFSAENLMFYLDVERHKALPFSNIIEIRNEAEEIWNKYIKNEASFQVNLSGPVVKEIQLSIEQLSNDSDLVKSLQLFNSAQDEILQLMASDSFKRFQRREEYQKLLPILQARTKTGESHTSHGDLDLCVAVGTPSRGERADSQIELQPLYSNNENGTSTGYGRGTFDFSSHKRPSTLETPISPISPVCVSSSIESQMVQNNFISLNLET